MCDACIYTGRWLYSPCRDVIQHYMCVFLHVCLPAGLKYYYDPLENQGHEHYQKLILGKVRSRIFPTSNPGQMEHDLLSIMLEQPATTAMNKL